MNIEDEVLEKLRQLPDEQKAKVLSYVASLEAEATKVGRARDADARARAAMRWIDEHRAEYAGQWVALDGDRLMASGDDARCVYEIARQQGVEVPFVDQVDPHENDGAFWGGWL